MPDDAARIRELEADNARLRSIVVHAVEELDPAMAQHRIVELREKMLVAMAEDAKAWLEKRRM